MPLPQKRGVPSINPLDFPAFVEEHPITVVYARRWLPSFDASLHKRLTDKYPAIACVQVDLIDVELLGAFAEPYISERNRELGRRDDAKISDGYYLFLDGRAIVFHSGLIEWEKDKVFVGVGGFFAIVGLLGNNSKVTKAGIDLGLSGPAWRVAEFFGRFIEDSQNATARGASDQQRQDTRRQQQQTVYENEYQRALKVLGASPIDAYEAVKKKRNDLLLKCHPDTSGVHVSNSDHEATVVINKAWEVICSHNGWRT